MQNAFLYLKSGASWQFRIVFLGGASFIFALLGPFGTFEALSFPARFLYWALLLAAADICVRWSYRIAAHFLADRRYEHQLAARSVCFAGIYTPVAWVLSSFFGGDLSNLSEFAVFGINIAAVTATLATLSYYLYAKTPPEAEANARLYDRLHGPTTAQIMRLTVDDHYVNVFLDDGSAHRVLMRLTDAIREMDGAPGFCTHRSHWVSRDHIVRGKKAKGREFVVLSDGSEVPVSKTYRENVQAAGFL